MSHSATTDPTPTNNDIKQTYKTRIAALRQLLDDNNVTAIIVPTADPHLSEYLPAYWQAREWLTGFTGSVGTLVVTADFAGLWTDSRYWVQAAEQLADTGIRLQKLQRGEPTHVEWLADNLKTGSRVVIDGDVLSLSEQDRLLDAFEEASDALESPLELLTDQDILDQLWLERPSLPDAPIYAHQAKFVSQSAQDKLTAIRKKMSDIGVNHHLLSSLDDIAWLTNLRGNDVEYNPVFLAHLLITEDSATLYVDDNKIDADVDALLAAADISIADYTAIVDDLAQLTATDALLLDPNKIAEGTLINLSDEVEIVEQTAPSTFLKSVKSEQDIAHIEEAMRQDGAALCEFFSDFEARLANGERLSELDVDSMLIAVRSQQPNYVSPSFPTIAGYNANGALPHYRALEDNFSYLDGNGLLLIDSGAQYQNGTTDITRVVGIGTVSEAQKRDFTIVLKAHIALAVAHFPDGLSAPLLDAICRAPLWREQLDYGHGTGHGVGYFLNVHEGPQGIAYSAPPTSDRAMKSGMLTSNEPGLYREGKWGIRIENLVVSLPVAKTTNDDDRLNDDFGDYLYFKTVTLCPIDTRLIIKDLLNQDEKDWLNDYHRTVYNELKDRIDDDALDWLTKRTQSI